MQAATYLIALGANRARPHATVARAAAALGASALSTIRETAPHGPRQRRYANAVACIESDLAPPAMLAHLKAIERRFGRRPTRRWGPRALDLDIIAWSGGAWRSRGLTIPHPSFRARRFVLVPLAEIAPRWRDPVTGARPRALLARLDRRRPAS